MNVLGELHLCCIVALRVLWFDYRHACIRASHVYVVVIDMCIKQGHSNGVCHCPTGDVCMLLAY